MSIRAAGAVRPPAAPPVRVAGGGRRPTSVRWEQVHEEVCLWTWVARLATRAMRGLTGLHRSGPRECESPSPGAEARGLVSADPASPTGVDRHQGRGQVSLSSSTHPLWGPDRRLQSRRQRPERFLSRARPVLPTLAHCCRRSAKARGPLWAVGQLPAFTASLRGQRPPRSPTG